MALMVRKGRSNRDVSICADIEDFNIDHPSVELCLCSSKGIGVFAKHDITRGTRILSEAPLVVITSANENAPLLLWQRLEKLSPSELKAFDSLHCNKELLDPKSSPQIRNAIIASGKLHQCPQLLDGFVEMERHRCGIFRTNATSMGPGQSSGVFPIFSRVNHSCTPNVYATYNRSLARHTIQAIRDIKEGEEITAAYVDCATPIQIRTTSLDDHAVECYCTACKTSPAAAKSEKNRRRLFEITHALRAYEGKLGPRERVAERWIPHNPTEALETAEERITILKEEGLVGMDLASAYRQSSRHCIQLGMVEKAKAYAKKELEVERYCLGVETEYLNSGIDGGKSGGSAEHWMKQIEWMAEKEKVKIRMCEKRYQKEQKKADKKAEKKAAKKSGRR